MTIGYVDTKIEFSKFTSAEERRICRLYESVWASLHLLLEAGQLQGLRVERILIVVVNLL